MSVPVNENKGGAGQTAAAEKKDADQFKTTMQAQQKMQGPLQNMQKPMQQGIAAGPGGCVVTQVACHPLPPQRPVLKVTQGRIWGDPHFIGEDGGKFDIMGEAGKTYNLLSDTGVQVNGLFEQWGNKKGTTVITEMGITTSHGHNIKIEDGGQISVNGMMLGVGQNMTLSDGSSVTNSGSTVQVSAGEWNMNVEVRGNHLNVDFRSDNAFSDGVLPDGLWGQTVDFDTDKRRAVDKQGTGAYRDAFATYKNYEVGTKVDGDWGLFNTDFPQYNNFNGGGYWYAGPMAVVDFSGMLADWLIMPPYSYPAEPYIYMPRPYFFY